MQLSKFAPLSGIGCETYHLTLAPIDFCNNYNYFMMKKGKGQNVTSYDKLSTNVTRSYAVSECDKMAQN